MSRAAVIIALPMAKWPETDRALWAAADQSVYVASMNPTSTRFVIRGYGRWLAFLRERSVLNEQAKPQDRVAAELVENYIDWMQQLGNAPGTIKSRLWQLSEALRILSPDCNFTWLHPNQLMSGTPRPRRSCLIEHQLRGWPLLDQKLWQAGLAKYDLLSGPRYAERLSAATIASFIVGYRRWLVFLRKRRQVHPASLPAQRVTSNSIKAYYHDLRLTNNNNSIVARFGELRGALMVMQPKVDLSWLTSPGGVSLTSWLPVSQTAIQTFDSEFLVKHGEGLMRDALLQIHPERRRLSYRDGLMFALFAARAPRVRSMQSLRLGTSIRKDGNAYQLIFEKEDVKTSRSIEYRAPRRLTAAIDRYIAVERAEMLGARHNDAFWVNNYGKTMTVVDIGNMIQRQSRKSLGVAFGPHRFRHCLGTTAPLADPSHPGVAASILGISGHMVEQHYNRANQADVANQFHASLEKDRAALESLARRQFQKRTKPKKPTDG